MKIKTFLLSILAMGLSLLATAQTNPNLETGIKPYGSYDASKIDSVNLLNGNLTVSIPLVSYPQRGSLHHNFGVAYNGKGWYVKEVCNLINIDECSSKWLPNPAWPGSLSVVADDNLYVLRTVASAKPDANIYTVYDYLGGSHLMGAAQHDPMLADYSVYRALDGSGYSLSTQWTYTKDTNTDHLTAPVYVRDKHGNQWTVGAANNIAAIGLPNFSVTKDSNGNILAWDGNDQVIDTMGRNLLLTVTASDTDGCRGPRAVSSAWIGTLPGPNNADAKIKLCGANVNLHTSFGAWDEVENPIEEYVKTTSLTQSIILYDGVSWTTSPQWIFEYADNADGSNYGDLTRLTLPTGGSISYTWGTTAPTCYSSKPGGTPASRAVTSRTVDDGTGPQVWSYVEGGYSSYLTRTVTDPIGNKVIHTFAEIGQTGSSECNDYEVKTDWYDKNGGLLKTENTEYTYTNTSMVGPDNQSVIAAISPSKITTTLPNGKVSQVQRDYVESDGSTGTEPFFFSQNVPIPLGNLIEERVYDYGNGGPGSLVKKTHYTYKAFQSANYLNPNLLDRISSVVISDGFGQQASKTTYGYDESGLQPSGVPASYLDTSILGFRGNQTSVIKWVGPSQGALTSTTTYYDSGMPYQVTDFGGHTTTYYYSPDYVGAYVTETRMPDTHSPNLVHHAISGDYDFNSGLVTRFTDQNGGVSRYSYDALSRIINASFPDSGGATFSYPSFTTIELNKKLDSLRSTDEYVIFDGVGRKIRSMSFNGTTWDQLDTCYYGDGTAQFKSYPYQGAGAATSRICTGPGDTYFYDGLQRVTQVFHSDSSHIDTTYTGAAVRTVDEGNGTRNIVKVSQSDALGRLTSVCEVTSTSLNGTGGSPSACGQDDPQTGFLTAYGYDALGNLTSASQGGYLARSFVYDGLSRLTQATNPESGSTYYTYTPDGQVYTRKRPLPNQFNTNSLVTTTYGYDELHRLRSFSYDDGVTSGATYSYDEGSVAGHPAGLSIGQLTSRTTNTSGEYFWGFDPMGRPQGRSQCTPRSCSIGGYYDSTYTYDYLGNPVAVGLPGQINLTNTYNLSSQLASVTSNVSDANHPASLLSNVQYGPFGMASATIGNLVSETRNYSPRGWLAGISDVAAIPETASGTITISGSELSTQVGIATPGSGNVVINGQEGSTQVQTAAATPGTGTVSFNGAERSAQQLQSSASPSVGSITINGTEKRASVSDCPLHQTCYIYDSGNVSITVNGQTASASYSQGSTGTSIASALVITINGLSNYPVSASSSSNIITLVSRATGPGTNYSLTSGYDYDAGDFNSPSFTPSTSGATMTGGADAVYATVYDTGTISVTAGGYTQSVIYGQSSSPSTLAVSLASAFNSGGTVSPVSASASGNVLILTSKVAGVSSNYALSSASATNSSSFTGSSFGAASASSLSGGQDATSTTDYDTGTLVVTINGLAKTVSYGQNSTGAGLASAIAGAFTADGASAVTATSSANVVNFVSKTAGASTNYSLTASASTSDPNLSTPSFSATPSGSSLSGGSADGSSETVYDTGVIFVTVNGYTKQIPYGQSDTASSLASSLASVISSDSNFPVNASATDTTVTLVSKQIGSANDYSFSATVQSTNSNFSSSSFTVSTSGGALTGGASQVPVYNFGIPDAGGFAANGDILKSIDSVNGNWTYTYDEFNRLWTAVTSGTGPNAGLGCGWIYDRFGNRLQQNTYNGSCFTSPFLSSTNTNRIDYYCYDAAGNLLDTGACPANGVHTYTYDAEGRISATAGGYSYVYNAEGNRAAKMMGGSIANEYLLEGSNQVVELDGTGNVMHTNLYAGGKLLATYEGGQTQFHLSDWLGNRRVQFNAQGQQTLSCTNLPFGDGLTCSGPFDATEHHFTGKERDSETGLDYFGARYYGSNMGRWMSPDLADKPEAVPYSSLDDPQTLNLYGYVRNNPVSHADVDGHCWPLCTTVIGGTIGGAVGAVSNFYSQWSSNGHSIAKIDTQKVAAATAGGAVSGALAGATLGVSLVRNAVVGASANVVGGVVQRAASGEKALDAKQMGKDALSGAASGVVGTAIAKSLVSSTVSTPSGQVSVETSASPSPYDIVKTGSGVQPVAAVQLNINTAATAAGNATSQTVNVVTTPSPQPKGHGEDGK